MKYKKSPKNEARLVSTNNHLIVKNAKLTTRTRLVRNEIKKEPKERGSLGICTQELTCVSDCVQIAKQKQRNWSSFLF